MTSHVLHTYGYGARQNSEKSPNQSHENMKATEGLSERSGAERIKMETGQRKRCPD